MPIDFQNVEGREGEQAAYPIAQLKALRDQGSVVWNGLLNGWMITKYADIKKVLADSKNFSNEDGGIREAFGENAMLFIDSTMHNTLRAIWSKELAANTVQGYYPLLSQISGHLLASARHSCSEQDSVEVVDIFKNYTIQAITTLMGLPFDKREDFKRWNMLISDAPQIRLAKEDPRFIRREKAKKEVFDFLKPAMEDRLRRINEGDEGDDLISLMVLAENSKGVDRQMVLDNLLNLFLGAYDTTVRWLGNIVSVLSRNPKCLAELRADPTRRGDAYDEIMRFESVVQVVGRVARNDGLIIGGQSIARGDEVFLMLGLGNRDSSIFENPDQLDFDRTKNPHLGFGFGIHQCLGAHIARVEVRAFMDRLLENFPRLEVHGADYGANWTLWGPIKLYMRQP